MLSRSIFLAALAGFWVDFLLSTLSFSGGVWLLGISDSSDLLFTSPAHILIGLVLPVLMTMIGGAVAGAIAVANPQPAGALVGGMGLLLMLLGGVDQSQPHALAMIIAQCAATVLAALTAMLAARYRLRRHDDGQTKSGGKRDE